MDLWIGNKKISFKEAIPEYVLFALRNTVLDQ